MSFGGILRTSWTRGGGHGEGDASNLCRFSLIPAEQGDDTASLFDSNVLVDNIDCRTRGSYQRDINLGVTPAGDYYLQFRWKAGDGGTWYNCAKVTIENLEGLNCTDNKRVPPETDIDCGSLCPACAVGKNCLVNSDCESNLCVRGTCQPPVTPVAAGTTENKLIVPASELIDYYSIVLEPHNFVFVTATAPPTRTQTSWAKYLLKSGEPPTEDANGSYSSRNLTISPSYSFTLCAEPEEATAYVGVRHSSDTAGQYSIKLENYKAELVFEGTLEDEVSTATSKYYNTPVYNTYTSKRLVIVEKISGAGQVALSYHRNTCGEPQNLNTFDDYACTEIQFNQEGTTWLNVVTSGPVRYKLIQKPGMTCEEYEKTRGSATLLLANLALTCLALLLAF